MSFKDKLKRKKPEEEARSVLILGEKIKTIIRDVSKALDVDLEIRIGIHTVNLLMIFRGE